MTNVIFFESNEVRRNLLPLTYTRPVALLRVGIDTIDEKWRAALGEDCAYSYLTATYLKAKYPAVVKRDNLMIAGHVIPDDTLVAQVKALKRGESLMLGEELIAFKGSAHDFDAGRFTRVVFCESKPLRVHWLYEIFEFNSRVMERDFVRLT
ncbi:MAG: glucose-1-phosphate thymidylyltransferase, partial [Muribaculaceae bacterium]|nr:glucose-1-phosphate thymidylyltransferase [Muribaculaceae bacterium]